MVGDKPRKPRFGAKSAFVRSLDRDLPAAEVVALADKKGLKLTAAFVYNIRSAEGRTQPPRGAAGKRGRGPNGNGNGSLTGSPEAQLRAAIAQIGLARARQILDEVEDTFAGR
jgi:hypothetical protein